MSLLRELQADVIRKALAVDDIEDAVHVANTLANRDNLRNASFALSEAVIALRTAAHIEGMDPTEL